MIPDDKDNKEMSEEEMREHHPLELEELQEGRASQDPPPASLRRRRRVFLPVAGFVTLLCVAGLYWFVTFEATAITDESWGRSRYSP